MTETTVADATNEDLDAPVELADKPREATPYEKKLRTEAANYRRRMQETEKASLAAIDAAKAEADALVATTRRDYTQRLMRSELKAHAQKAGITDLELLSLLDLSAVKMTDEGEVTNADELIQGWRKAKPHFFGALGQNTSSTASAPKPSTQPTLVSEMSEAEIKAFERQNNLSRTRF